MQHAISANRRAALTASLLLVSFSTGHVANAVPAPTAPATSTGSYTVTYTRCSACYGDWIEERANGGAWTAIGQGAVSFTAKPAGRYDYRAGYFYVSGYYTYWTEYSASTSVAVSGGVSAREPLETQMTYQYRARGGDIDLDGRKDLYLERILGGAPGDGALHRVLLRQRTGGTFEARAPSAAERSVAAAWPSSSATIALRDVNVDGFVDVILGRLSSALGASNVANQIVYAPASASGTTRGVRSVDPGLRRFGTDIVEYLKDSDYFSANAPIRVEAHTYYDFVCGYGYGYNPDYDVYGYDCYPVPVTIVIAYPDYSSFSPSAVDIWSRERSIEQGLTSAGQGLDAIEAEIEDVLDVDVAEWDIRELLGGSVPDPDRRRGIELFAALLGIATASAQEPGSESSPPNSVLITGRRIMGFLPMHTALQYGVTTVSAHDDDDRALIDGTLVSQVNWPPDHPLLTMRLGTVSGGVAAALYWSRVLSANSNYDDELPYDTLPSLGSGGYNSNGYTHGLIQATNGVPSIRMEDFVGGEVPVPRREFN